MCGIAGIWNDVGGEASRAVVSDMLDAIQHRGPDGRGKLQYAGGCGGMVRLSLVDLSDRGQQPIWSPDRQVAILYNGEIYNFREERERLAAKGYPFQSTTDTEVVLALYMEKGEDFVHSLRGMYGLAIFDFRAAGPDGPPKLILVRGAFGIKPLYVAAPTGNPRGVIFCSEVRGLLASGRVRRQIDREGLVDFLSCGFLLQPRTMIEGVRMLEPGSIEVYEADKPPRIERYWRMPDYVPRKETLNDAAQRLRAVLEESVRLHALADAPVGAFLSGGIDSTGIVGLMRKHVSDLRTYTLRFPDMRGLDESNEAVEAAQRFDCKNTIVDVVGSDLAPLIPEFVRDLDQPSTDGLNTWIISRAAARDVKGVLSGVGGDEWFAGYTVTRRMAHYANSFSGKLQRAAGYLADWFGPVLPTAKLRERAWNLAGRRSSLSAWVRTHTVFDYDVARRFAGLRHDPHGDEVRLSIALDGNSDHWRSETPVGLSCLLDTRIYMIDQLLRDSDATSMAHSLELRTPLVDWAVANFSRSCLDDYKLDRTGGSSNQYAASGAKKVLVKALEDVLPPDILTRKKRGFALPYRQWMSGPLKPLVDVACDRQTIRERGLIDPRLFDRWMQQREPGFDPYPRLWSLMILEHWCRANLDASKPAAVAV